MSDERDWIERFVDDLFTNGSGHQAERLVLWRDSDQRNLGGWCKQSIIDRLHAHREQALTGKPHPLLRK